MSANKDFDVIMHEITSKLSGNAEEDIKYLGKECERYKDHPLASEIIRACGRIISQIMPPEKQEELHRLVDNHFTGTKATLEEAKFNAFQKKI